MTAQGLLICRQALLTRRNRLGVACRVRQTQSYDGSAARRIASDRRSAVRAGDGLDDGEPQAGASVVTGAAGIRAPEALECVRQESWREAGTIIADLDVKVRAAGPGGQHDDRAARGEPHRVIQQVVDGLADPVRVDAGAQAGGGHRGGR